MGASAAANISVPNWLCDYGRLPRTDLNMILVILAVRTCASLSQRVDEGLSWVVARELNIRYHNKGISSKDRTSLLK